ncbi:hypothetical protein BC829DRAFT_349933, partial [Chytridium lagenaria]
SVSWKPIPPPHYSLLEREASFWPPRIFRAGEDAILNPGTVFYLEGDSQCVCGLKIRNCDSEKRFRWCMLYTEQGAVRCFIETAKCSRCPPRYNRFIGPDLGDRGIFNKNNFCLITHFFLDKITELITSTTFSFHAYSKHLQSNYNEFG